MGARPDAIARTRSVARAAVALGGAALLAWFVGAQAIAAIAARGTNVALLQRFDPTTYPDAGSRLAQVQLQLKQPDRAVALARPAALANPMSVRAVRTLGLSLDPINKPAAARIMRVAEELSWRDTPTSLWVLLDAGVHRDIARALDQVDALARRQVQSEMISKIFYAGLTDAPSRRAFAGLLARTPPWRGGFFANIRVNLPPPSFARMELLLDQLDRTPAPPTPEERLTFIDRMTDTGDGRHARAYWMRSFTIPPAQRGQTPYDPRFRALAARRPGTPTSPFDWGLNGDMGQFVELRETDGEAALDVASGAEDGTALASQVLVLAPGRHRIDTAVRGPAGQAPAGWQVTCSQSGTPLIRTFARPGDELSGVTVDVPADGCPVQRLSLTANGRVGASPISIRQVTVR